LTAGPAARPLTPSPGRRVLRAVLLLLPLPAAVVVAIVEGAWLTLAGAALVLVLGYAATRLNGGEPLPRATFVALHALRIAPGVAAALVEGVPLVAALLVVPLVGALVLRPDPAAAVTARER
jgi:hypothetical protein